MGERLDVFGEIFCKLQLLLRRQNTDVHRARPYLAALLQLA